MRLFTPTALAAVAAITCLNFPAPVKALRVAARELATPQRALQADVVVVGVITDIEKELSQASLAPGAPQKVDFRVATLKITEPLAGVKGLTHIRVGFQPLPEPPAAAPEGRLARPIRAVGVRPANLTEGQEGCFFLRRHHEADFFVAVPLAPPLNKKADSFEKDLGQVKRVLKVLEDPAGALKAKDAADRRFAAGVLLTKYRTYPQGVAPDRVKQEPVPAEESRLLLETLAGMDWANPGADAPFNVQQLWYSLGVTPKDGWTQPKFDGKGDFNQLMGDAVKAWLTKHASDYRLQRFAVGK